MVYTTTIAADNYDKSETPSVFTTIGRALTRIRFQLLGGVFFAVAAPAILRGNFERFVEDLSHYENSLIGTFCALIFGFMIFRKVTALPGAGAVLRVVPAFLLSYGTVAIIFFALRLDYSRYQFVMSLTLVIAWFLFVMFAIGRSRKPVLALVPGGVADRLAKLGGIRWKPVDSPKLAEAAGRVPLVVDLKNPELTDDWERYIAEAAISGRPVFNAKQLAESLTGRVQIAHLSENTFGHLSPDSIYAPAKRYIDAFTALIALVVFSPLLILTAIAVKPGARHLQAEAHGLSRQGVHRLEIPVHARSETLGQCA
jgi:hypothetical protein